MSVSCSPWPHLWPCEEPPSADPAVVRVGLRTAQRLLSTRSGGIYGDCTATEKFYPRPASTCGMPYKDRGGLWRNGGRGGACCALPLRFRPVRGVVEATLFGEVLDPESYGVEGFQLVRYAACWPASDECGEPPVSVTYRWGRPIEEDAQLALGEVALEVIESLCGRPCRLPSKLSALTRQGVTMEFSDSEEQYERWLLGLPLADAWLQSVNPNAKKRRVRFSDPDSPRSVVR